MLPQNVDFEKLKWALHNSLRSFVFLLSLSIEKMRKKVFMRVAKKKRRKRHMQNKQIKRLKREKGVNAL